MVTRHGGAAAGPAPAKSLPTTPYEQLTCQAAIGGGTRVSVAGAGSWSFENIRLARLLPSAASSIDDRVIAGRKMNPGIVLEFYDRRRHAVRNARPNAAHRALVDPERKYDVRIVTQNADDLHRRESQKMREPEGNDGVPVAQAARGARTLPRRRIQGVAFGVDFPVSRHPEDHRAICRGLTRWTSRPVHCREFAGVWPYWP